MNGGRSILVGYRFGVSGFCIVFLIWGGEGCFSFIILGFVLESYLEFLWESCFLGVFYDWTVRYCLVW